MQKTLLITGSTDGIGLLAAEKCVRAGHRVLIHGRSQTKLDASLEKLRTLNRKTEVVGYQADLANVADVERLAQDVMQNHDHLDALINNAGVLKASNTLTNCGIDVRLFVNTLAPYKLTQRLLPMMQNTGRVINVASAAQAPIDLRVLEQNLSLDDMDAYSQSKLGIILWSKHLASVLTEGPTVIAVNPGSLLASKMVKDHFGIAGKDMNIGADILCELALSEVHTNHSGDYFDNDIGRYGPAHAAAYDSQLAADLVTMMDKVWNEFVQTK